MRHDKEPEWNAENINRKAGSTTFKTCGWCEYVGCGTCRYNCHLSAYCDLMKDYGDEREVTWDTPCKVMKLGEDDKKSIVASKIYEVKSLKQQIKDAEKQIQVLKKLRLTKKPPLPDNRTTDYNDGEIIYVFHANKWNRGTVVPGYRSHDGCVSYILDDYPESKTKGPWGCGVSVPCVLKEWEYKYFKSRLNEFNEWLALCDREYNGKKLGIKDYYDAMKGTNAINS
jgi:hypothetical protein